MAYLKLVCIALFAAAVVAKIVYVVVKTIRIAALRVDPPMAGFDSEPEAEASFVREIGSVHDVTEDEPVAVLAGD